MATRCCCTPVDPCAALISPALPLACRDKGTQFAAGLLAPVSVALTVGILLMEGATALAAYGGCRRHCQHEHGMRRLP